MNAFDFIRSLNDPCLALLTLVLGMLGWVCVYLAVLLVSALQKGVVRQNIALRHEISILRKALGESPPRRKRS